MGRGRKKKESTVYFADLRADAKHHLHGKIGRMLDRLELGERIADEGLVAVKLHFGERGNTAFVRPVLVRTVVDRIKASQGRPFLVDTNTLYVGTRGDTVRHLETASAHGFSPHVAGAPVLIGGGLRGNRCVPVRVDLPHYREVEIAPEIVDADAVVGLTHFKGHEMSGFGGTLKNFGMGTASRQGKLSMHSTASPFVKKSQCTGCRTCLTWCAFGALAMEGKKARIDGETCSGCGACLPTCPTGAIRILWNQGVQEMQEKMVEYACGALLPKKGKSLFLNFITNVTPLCDCYSFSGAPIVRDIGVAASDDPVALDQASADLVNGEAGNPASDLESGHAPGGDKFRGCAPKIDWTIQLDHGERCGLGSRAYRLVTV